MQTDLRAGQSITARILGSLRLGGSVIDVRVGIHWTVVVVETVLGRRAGLAATQIVRDPQHGRPMVRDAGNLIGKQAIELAGLALSESLTERSIGFATTNALLEVEESLCVDRNAEEIILEKSQGQPVAVIGHFPFVSHLRQVAKSCWVLELEPREGDFPAAMAPELVPQAHVVAITGMTLINGTLENLLNLCSPNAYVLVLGPSTPLSPLLFECGVDAVSGTVVVDISAVVAAASEGATFRQMPGRRLVTMTASGPRR